MKTLLVFLFLMMTAVFAQDDWVESVFRVEEHDGSIGGYHRSMTFSNTLEGNIVFLSEKGKSHSETNVILTENIRRLRDALSISQGYFETGSKPLKRPYISVDYVQKGAIKNILFLVDDNAKLKETYTKIFMDCSLLK